MPLAKAEKQPLTTERLREQLGRLGGTPFKLGELKNDLSGDVLLPVSELNRLRRELVGELERLRVQLKRWQLKKPSEERALRAPDIIESRPRGTRPSEAQLIVLVRNLPQLETALRCDVTTIYCEFEDPKKYREPSLYFTTLLLAMVGRAVPCPPLNRPPMTARRGLRALPSGSHLREFSRPVRNGFWNRSAPAMPTAI